jgi:hypothetical protein
MVAALGDALFGERLRRADAGEAEARDAFETFLAEMINGFLESKI